MSLTVVRPFLRDRMEALGFDEHRDAFNTDNIASTIMDNTFHMETGTISSEAANQIDHDFDYPIVLRVFKKGFRNTVEAYDAIDQTAQDILEDLLDPEVRLGTAIKDIVPDTILSVELDSTNDNIIVLEMSFTFKLIQCFNN